MCSILEKKQISSVISEQAKYYLKLQETFE